MPRLICVSSAGAMTSTLIRHRGHRAAKPASVCARTSKSRFMSDVAAVAAVAAVAEVDGVFQNRGEKPSQHTSAYVSIRQYTSEYVSVRPHTPAYVYLCCRGGVRLPEERKREHQPQVHIRSDRNSILTCNTQKRPLLKTIAAC